ncbi:PadR family transcriptional regulator [Streptomyces pharetrae]|uniref:PadR family transcriptional regulator n=1 Tax=Streptomyces pharetrae TaxID=291370 RepID=UPI003665C364
MLELSILGFLAEQPLHGYELKERIKALSGHVRPVSDGALYPAITRLVAAGKLDQHTEPGASAAPRRILSLTEQGRADLYERLRRPKQTEITDQVRFNTVLAFLRHLPDPAGQAAVLRRRLDFLQTPASFFYRDGEPVRAEEAGDLFRQGMLRVARATGEAERAWLREAIAVLESAAPEATGPEAATIDAAPPAAAPPAAARPAATAPGRGTAQPPN